MIKTISIDLGEVASWDEVPFRLYLDESVKSASAACWCTSLKWQGKVLIGTLKAPKTKVNGAKLEKSVSASTENYEYRITVIGEVYENRELVEKVKLERYPAGEECVKGEDKFDSESGRIELVQSDEVSNESHS